MMLSSINAELNDYNERSGQEPHIGGSTTNSDSKLSAFNDNTNTIETNTETKCFNKIAPIECTSASISALDETRLPKNATDITSETQTNGLLKNDISNSHREATWKSSNKSDLYRYESIRNEPFAKFSSRTDKYSTINGRISSSSSSSTSSLHTPTTNGKLSNNHESETMKNLRNSKYLNSFNKSYSIDTDSSYKSYLTSPYRNSTFVRSKSVLSNNSYSSSKLRASSVVNDLTERLKSLDDTPSLLKKIGNTRNSSDNLTINRTIARNNNNLANSCFNRELASSTIANKNYISTSISPSLPWSITNRRAKFRITQMSRDVPIGSPDSHQTVFLDEAAHTTKDCLLHLLEKYNGNTKRNLSSIGRHQSISVGYGISDNLEYRSINSLNTFFKRNAHGGNNVKQIQARIESKHK